MTSKNQTPKSLIIWDKDSKFDITESTVVNSEQKFEKTKWSDFDVIFILAELGWRSRTEFYGFTVAKILRLEKKLTCPIIFCSFMENFNRKEFPDSKILGRPGHYFLRLPDQKPQFEKYLRIDEDLLEDINGDLFDTQQFIRNIVHDIPGALRKRIDKKEIKNPEKVFIVLKNLLKPIRELFSAKGLSRNFDSIEKKICTTIENTINQSGFEYNLIDSNDFLQLITPDEHEDIKDWVERKWQVLFIDDEKLTGEKMARFFKERKITCHTAVSATNAFEILKEDAKDRTLISVIISDYRLYENGDSDSDSRKWQKMQGLQILKHVYYESDFKNHYAYVMFTQKGSVIKTQITKQQKFQILWFNKRDVLGGGDHSFNIFCNRIIEIGDKAYDRMHPIPRSKVWKTGSTRVKPGLDFYYRLHKDNDYEKEEIEINKTVLSEIEFILNSNRLKYDYYFQCELKYNLQDQAELLKKFRTNILIPRRIFWLLFHCYEKDENDIIEIFNKAESQKTSIFNTSLGLSGFKNKKIAMSSMLYEEKKFCEEYCPTQ